MILFATYFFENSHKKVFHIKHVKNNLKAKVIYASNYVVKK